MCFACYNVSQSHSLWLLLMLISIHSELLTANGMLNWNDFHDKKWDNTNYLVINITQEARFLDDSQYILLCLQRLIEDEKEIRNQIGRGRKWMMKERESEFLSQILTSIRLEIWQGLWRQKDTRKERERLLIILCNFNNNKKKVISKEKRKSLSTRKKLDSKWRRHLSEFQSISRQQLRRFIWRTVNGLFITFFRTVSLYFF
jgi:hypothetical protein